jgi:hypothetical protein
VRAYILLNPVFPKAAELAKNPEKKEGVIYQIAFPEASRLCTESVKPFQAGTLHPSRCLAHESGMEIKGRSDCKKEATA